MEKERFFDDLKPWSKRKHRLLGKYLKPFSAKIASITIQREIYCIDGFAGTAKYDDGSIGSPLLMAQISNECAKWNNPVILRIINVEPKKKNFESLKYITQQWEEKGIVTNLMFQFSESVSRILSIVGNVPTLFFIDPFGPSYVYFEHLLPILKRSQQATELIINFDTDGLYRIACASISTNINPKTAATDAEVVKNIVGSNNWQSQFALQKPSTQQGEKILLEEYINNLNKFGYHVVAYPIRESLDKKPKYHFVYCTRHKDGVGLMNDFIREEEDLLYGEHIEESMTLFSSSNLANEEINGRREKLRGIMRRYLEKQGRLTRNQVIRNLVENYFGHFHSKDYRKVFKEFIDSGMLKTTDDKTKIDDRIYIFSVTS